MKEKQDQPPDVDVLGRRDEERPNRRRTERKCAETTPRESEERLQEQLRELNQIYQCSPVGLYVLDSNLRFLRINERLAEIDGIPAEEHLGRTIFEIVPHLAERLQLLWRPVFEKGESVLNVEIQGETPKAPGVQRHWLASYFPVKSAVGEVTGLMAAVLEITERKRAEEALRISEVKFKALAEQSITGTCLIQDGKLVYVNPRLAEMLNFRPEEMVGLPLLDLVAEPDRDLVRENIRKRLSREVPYMRYDFHALKKGGAQVPMEVHGTVIEYLGGPAIMGTLLDITERIRTEQSLATAHAELEARVAKRTAELKRASGKLRDELVERKRAEAELQVLSRRLIEVQESERRHLAHELHDEIGQILTGVKLMLDTLLSLPPPAMAKRLAEAQQLVGDLLQRVQNMSLALRPGVLDDFGLLPALEGLFRRYTSQTGVKVVFECHLAERRFVPELETASYRVVQEALTNVARHAGVADVSVRAWAEDGMLGLEIGDRGTGFDAQAVLAAGTSSGLPGMRERVLLLRGSLTIRSAPGRGTELSIRLPIRGLDRSRGGRHGRARGS
jgi:PAS domain S-box-containing protein